MAYTTSEQLSNDLLNITMNDATESLQSKVALLEQCELLSHKERMKRMVEVGRESISNPTTVLEQLSTGSVYEGILAVQATWGSGDLHIALNALRSSTSVSLRYRATKLLMLKGDDQMAQEALLLIPENLKYPACHWLRKRDRFAIVESYLETLDVHSRLLRKFLPTASKDFVAKTLPSIFDEIENWPSLIRLHAATVCKVLREAIASTPECDLDSKQTKIISIMAKVAPQFAKDLIDVVLQREKLSWETMKFILKWRPRETTQRFMDENIYQRKNLDVARIIKKLSTEQILRLYKEFSYTISPSAIEKLSLDQRRVIWEAVGPTWRSENGTTYSNIVRLLPADLRVQEVHRTLTLESFLELGPRWQIEYIELLSWDEATVKLRAFIYSNDVETRKHALSGHIQSAAFSPDHAQDVIDLILQHQHEPETVRVSMYISLAALPLKFWGQEHLSGITKIIRNALDDSDLSRKSIATLRKFIGQLLPYHTEWAAEQAVLFLEERPRIPYYEESNFKTISQNVLPAFLPLMRRFHEQRDGNSLLDLFEDFQTHLASSDDAINMLKDFIVNTTDKSQSTRALEILYQSYPNLLADLVPTLMEKDRRFFGTMNPIVEYMQFDMQRLFIPHVVADFKTSGRDNGPSIAMTATKCKIRLYRWTEKQQETFAGILLEYLRNSRRSTRELQLCIRTLARLSFIDSKHITSFANDTRPPVRDTALRRMAHLDSEEGIPTLFKALGDYRARIAIYSLRSYILSQPSSKALEILRQISVEKVTVAKEVYRLIGDINTDEAFQYLLSMYETDLHVDVRITLLKRLELYSEHDEIWNIFSRALQYPEKSVPIAVAETLVSLLRQGKTTSMPLFREILTHPERDVRMVILSQLYRNPYLHHNPLTDTGLELVDPLLDMMKQYPVGGYNMAAVAIFNLYGKDHPEIVTKAFDLHSKNAQALRAVFNIYNTKNITRFDASNNAVLSILRREPITRSMQLELIFQNFCWNDIRDEMDTMIDDLNIDSLVLAEKLTYDLASKDSFAMEEIERTWGRSKNERLRRLGLVALITLAEEENKWTEELKERLAVYRNDESSWIIEAATFPQGFSKYKHVKLV